MHISYRLDPTGQIPFFWQARSNSQKELIRKRRNFIQEEIKNELGLVVDVPKPGGSGTSTNGNCARRAFRNHKKLAKILDVDEELGKKAMKLTSLEPF